MKILSIFLFYLIGACKPQNPASESETRNQEQVKSLPIVNQSAPFTLPPLTSRATAPIRENGYRFSPLGLKVNWRAEPRVIKDPEEVPFTHFVIHHTAKVWVPPAYQSPDSWTTLCRDSFRDIVDSQIKPPQSFDDIAYHFVICPTGEVFEGRPGRNIVGAGAWGQNQGAVGISLMGQYSPDQNDQKTYGFNAKLPEAQLEALSRLIAWLSDEAKIDIESPKGDFLYNAFSYKKLLESKISFKQLPDVNSVSRDSPDLNELSQLKPEELANRKAPKIRATTRAVGFMTHHMELAALVPQGFCMKGDCGTYPEACPGKLVVSALPDVLAKAIKYKRELYPHRSR